MKTSKSQAARDWFRLRLSGAGLFVLTIWFLVSVAMLAGSDYGAVLTWVKMPFVTVLLVLFVGLVFYHLRLGVHEVIEDYVHNPKTKSLLLLINTGFALVFGLLGLVQILRISLGAA